MEEANQTIKQVILDLLTAMEVVGTVDIDEGPKGLIFNIQSNDSRSLIGRQGLNLHAFQTIVTQLTIKKLGYGQVPRFSIDVDDYKRKREWFLRQSAEDSAKKVISTRQSVSLELMPRYERRYVHSFLQENFPDLITESIGFEPNRRIVIRLK